ncbi:hypothetical protein ACFYM0_18645 [Streptomyces sp. NPDC006487]|uniref:hypothetical protein n=1 Tax=Streptomyces sp. NPDC006487 TaxID=3364748 RepID=UPI003676D2E9
MTHRPRTRQRFAVLTASAALAATGALLPSNAFAASTAAPQADPTSVTAAASGRDGHRDRGDDGYRIRYCHWHQRSHHQSWGRWDCHTYWYGNGHWNGHGNGDWKNNWKNDWKGDWSGHDGRGHRA